MLHLVVFAGFVAFLTFKQIITQKQRLEKQVITQGGEEKALQSTLHTEAGGLFFYQHARNLCN